MQTRQESKIVDMERTMMLSENGMMALEQVQIGSGFVVETASS